MQLVTLTTDFGSQDYYVPALKGTMLSRNPALNIVDVSHEIKHHDIIQAAFVLRNSWSAFPEGTIHVVSVNNFGGEKGRFLAFKYQKHIFIGPDNGIFTLIFPKLLESTPPTDIVELPFVGLNFEYVKDVIVHAVNHLTSQSPLDMLGNTAKDILQRITFQPVIAPSQIRGSVIYIDHYDNVVSNITRELFEKVGRGRSFQLYFKRHDPILRLSRHYNDVSIGEALCLFNSGYLELAINMGKAAEMYGLKIEDTIQIDFH
ncbi:MAG: SAM-dependent chlorinase/fluorinase [Saprospiraceae bacterium]|nr:SAM-dependent chlorinase/fluorinase [Saprospiraceae bacterium]